jgi:hypothetical protein
MLKKLQNAVVIALFACLVIGFGIAVWSASQRPHSPIQYKSSPQKERSADKHTTEEREKPEEALARYTWWLVAFTGVLAGATIGLGVGTFGLYRAGEKQIVVAKKTADAANLNAQAVIEAERARLYVIIEAQTIESEVKRATAPRHPPLADDVRLQDLVVEYSFRNYGKTPAFILEMGHGAAVTETVPKGRQYTVLVPLPVDYVVGAGEKTIPMRAVNMPTMSVATAKAIRDMGATFWFHGYVEYDDTFGWRRKFDFVWHYDAAAEGFRLFSYRETAEKRET